MIVRNNNIGYIRMLRGGLSYGKGFCRQYRCREVLGIARKFSARSLSSAPQKYEHRVHESRHVGSCCWSLKGVQFLTRIDTL